jgi:cytidylate kinase
MAISTRKGPYLPGTYIQKRPDFAITAERYFEQWQKKIEAMPRETYQTDGIPPTICLSRRIGAGALDIADYLSQKTGFRIADRLIIEHIARQSRLSQKTVQYFDERYPGKTSELAAYLFGEKSFVMSSYARQLISVVLALAEAGSTIFVGRGAHLILPPENILAVRLICTRTFREKRLSEIHKISLQTAGRRIAEIDAEQDEFFKKVFGKKQIMPEDFDLVINSDRIVRPEWAGEIIRQAFENKFSETGLGVETAAEAEV